MFYPHKITNIKDTDRVLEIGPGSNPYFRSDVLLELNYNDEHDRVRQFGHSEKLVTDKQIVYYDGLNFPFKDKEFDYVICSHVLEHVEDLKLFLSEIFRVSSKGYFEYPLATYDYLYNFDVHINFLKYDGNKLLYMRKQELPLNSFKPFQKFFLKTLDNGYGDFLGKIPHCFFEGFEWKMPFDIVQDNQLDKFIIYDFEKKIEEKPHEYSIRTSLSFLIKAIKNKLINV